MSCVLSGALMVFNRTMVGRKVLDCAIRSGNRGREERYSLLRSDRPETCWAELHPCDALSAWSRQGIRAERQGMDRDSDTVCLHAKVQTRGSQNRKPCLGDNTTPADPVVGSNLPPREGADKRSENGVSVSKIVQVQDYHC
jgi:hypothetical protein